MANKFAPPKPEELKQFAPPEQPGAPSFAPPTKDQLTQFAPPEDISKKEKYWLEQGEGFVRQTELDDIAKKYGVSRDKLQDMVAWYGGMTSPEDFSFGHAAIEGLKETATAMPFGDVIPFVMKKMEDDPNTRKAMDEVKNLIMDRTGAGKVAQRIGPSIAAPTGITSRALQAVSAPIIGAMEGLFTSDEGEEGWWAAAGATLGGLFSAPQLIGMARGKAKTKAAKKIVDDVDEISTPQFENQVDKVFKGKEPEMKVMERSLEDFDIDLVKKDPLLRQETAAFSKFVNKDLDALPDYIEQEGIEFAKNTYRQMKRAEAGSEVLGEVLSPRDNFTKKAIKFYKDAKYVYRDIDDKYGTSTEAILDEVSDSYNKYLSKMLKSHNAATKAASASKGIDNDILYEALDNKKAYLSLGAEDKVKVDAWRKFFDEQANEARKIGLGLEKRQHYVPHHLKSAPELSAIMTKKKTDLENKFFGGNKIETLSSEQLKPIFSSKDRTPEIVEWIKAVKILTGETLNNKRALNNALFKLDNADELHNSLMTRTGAVLKRKGKMPKFIRETDVRKLAQNWSQSVLRHASMRDKIIELKAQGLMLRQSGDLDASNYILNHVADIAGVRRGSGASASAQARRRFVSSMLKKSDATDNKLLKAGYKTAAKIPDAVVYMGHQMYPYYLGMRIDAPLRNLTQPILLSAPTLANPKNISYGYRLALKGQLDAVADIAKGRNIVKGLREKGMMPPTFTGEAVDWTRNGVRQGLRDMDAKDISKSTLETLNDLAMKLYTASDTHNRVVTASMGRKAAKDMWEGIVLNNKTADAKAAIRLYNQLPNAYKNRVQKAIKAKDPEMLEDTINRWLLSTTQFNYNKVSMNEFGRFLGSWFAMFSKWPASISGDVIRQLGKMKVKGERANATMQLGLKYMAPLVGFGYLNGYLENNVDEELKKTIFGHDTMTWAPASSVIPLTQMEIRPPLLQRPLNAVEQIMKGNPDKAGKELFNSAASAIPGAVWWKAYDRYLGEE